MADEKPPAGRRTPVDAWETSEVGLDNDAWLNRYRRSLKPHESPDDALAFYTRIFEEAPVAILIVTPRFLIADANAAAQNLLKRSLSQLRGSVLQTKIAKVDRAAFLEISREIIIHPGSVTRPLTLKAADDVEIEINLIACALRDQDDVPELVIMMLLDRGDNISSDIL